MVPDPDPILWRTPGLMEIGTMLRRLVLKLQDMKFNAIETGLRQIPRGNFLEGAQGLFTGIDKKTMSTHLYNFVGPFVHKLALGRNSRANLDLEPFGSAFAAFVHFDKTPRHDEMFGFQQRLVKIDN